MCGNHCKKCIWTLFVLKTISMWFWIPRTSQHFLKFACCPDSSKVGQHRLYQAGMAELLVMRRVKKKNSKRTKLTAISTSEQDSQRKDKF